MASIGANPRAVISTAAALARDVRMILGRDTLFPIEKRHAKILQSSPPALEVVVIGPYSAGKSSFINALIGKGRVDKKSGRPIYSGLLPVGVAAKTAIKTTIACAKDDQDETILAHLVDGSVERLSGSDADKIIGLKGRSDQSIEKQLRLKRDSIREVEYALRLPTAYQRFKIVDTPGIDSMHEDHDERARAAVRSADAVLFLVEDHVNEAEKHFVMDVKDWVDNIIFVQTRCDREDDPADVLELTASNGRTMTEWLSRDVMAFIPTSAFEEIDLQAKGPALFEKPQTPGFASVLEQIERICDRRIGLKEDMACREALEALDDLEQHLRARLVAETMEPAVFVNHHDEKHIKCQSLEAQRALLRTCLVAHQEKVRENLDAICESLRSAWILRITSAANEFRSGSNASERCANAIQRKARELYEVELRAELLESIRNLDETTLTAIQKHLGVRLDPLALEPCKPTLNAPIIPKKWYHGFLSFFRLELPASQIQGAIDSTVESIIREAKRIVDDRINLLNKKERSAYDKAREHIEEDFRGRAASAATLQAGRLQTILSIETILQKLEKERRQLHEQLQVASADVATA